MFQKVGINSILLLSIVFSTIVVNSSMVRADTTLTVWYIEDEFIDDTFLALIDQFEIDYSVIVNIVKKTPDNIRVDFQSAYLLGTAPDIIQADSVLIPDLVHKNMLLPLKESDFDGNYLDGAKRAVSFFYREDGSYLTDTLAYYGFPQSVDTIAFIYNKDKSTKATIPLVNGAWTMTQFRQQVAKMNDQSVPSNKQFGMTYINFLKAAEALFLGAKGVMFSNYAIDAINNQINSTVSRNALQYIYNFTNLYEYTPSYKTGYYVDPSKNLLYERIYEDFTIHGNVSSTMLFANQLKKLMATGIFSNSSKLGIGPSPQDDTEMAPFLEVKALMISRDSENQAEAKNLARFLTSKSAMIENAKNESILPAILECYDDPQFLSDPIIQSYKILIQRASPQYLTRFWIPVEEIFETQTTSMICGNLNGEICAVALKVYWNKNILGVTDIPGIGTDLSGFKRWGGEADNENPTISINNDENVFSLLEGQSTINITITWNSSDDVGVTQIKFYQNETFITNLEGDISAYSIELSEGYYNITVIAFDAAGNSAQNSLIIHVNSYSPPTTTPSTPKIAGYKLILIPIGSIILFFIFLMKKQISKDK